MARPKATVTPTNPSTTTTNAAAPRAVRTTAQTLAQQKVDANREHAANAAAANKPDDLAAVLDATKPAGAAVAPVAPTAVAMLDGRTPREAYLDEVAPAAIVGRLIKFTREGMFVTADDEGEIAD